MKYPKIPLSYTRRASQSMNHTYMENKNVKKRIKIIEEYLNKQKICNTDDGK